MKTFFGMERPMNPQEYYTLTEEQQKRYLSQPDNIPSYKFSVSQNQETTYYVKGAAFRFWYNTINAGYENHWQTSLEVIFVTDGTYNVTIGETLYEMQPGDILLVPPGAVHSIETPKSGSRLIFLLELDQFSQLPNFNFILSILAQPKLISYDENPELYAESAKMLRALCECYWGESSTKTLQVCAMMLSWFVILSEHAIEDAPITSSTTLKTSTLMNRLSKVLDYIDTHFSENITLEEAASIACFSKFYFTRLFKQYTNQTFYDYLSAKRIHAAEQMLIIPNLAITEISSKSGFSSLSSFNRTFKRLKGCSPSEYRSLYIVGNRLEKKDGENV